MAKAAGPCQARLLRLPAAAVAAALVVPRATRNPRAAVVACSSGKAAKYSMMDSTPLATRAHTQTRTDAPTAPGQEGTLALGAPLAGQAAPVSPMAEPPPAAPPMPAMPVPPRSPPVTPPMDCGMGVPLEPASAPPPPAPLRGQEGRGKELALQNLTLIAHESQRGTAVNQPASHAYLRHACPLALRPQPSQR